MKLPNTVLARLAVCGLTFVACSSDTVPSPGGGASGAPSNGQNACGNVSACGGDVLGTWNVTGSCLKLSGTLDLGSHGAGCATAPVTGTVTVTGSWTATADGLYTDHTVTNGSAEFTLVPACLTISSTPVECEKAGGLLGAGYGYSPVTCTPSADGNCTCQATIHVEGGLGIPSAAPTTSSNYASANNTLALSLDSGEAAKFPYCTSGDTLTLTPQTMYPATTGSITLQRASGTGGAAGAAGSMSSGGVLGSSGSSGIGGANGGSGGTGGTGGTAVAGSAGSGGGQGSGMGPCDIYKAGGNPCVAAHSTTRALLGTYGGKLYQVQNAAGMTKDIMPLSPGGVADGASQDAFCMGTTCVITVLYDQSGKGNDLWYQGSAQVPASNVSLPAKATTEALNVGGNKVYSLYINPHNSYWVDSSKSGIALGAEPEGMYMVTSGKHFNGGCCFDYGNSEVDRKADGSGAMDALNLSSITSWGTGAGNGPWVMADLEYGVFAQNNTMKNMNNPSQTATYVTAMLKNDGTKEFALRGSDAAAGNLATYYKGPLPGGWSPMKKQGAIVLGSGGDCCKPGGGANDSDGTFYEGCIVTGYPSDATEAAVQANIVAAQYRVRP